MGKINFGNVSYYYCTIALDFHIEKFDQLAKLLVQTYLNKNNHL